MANDVLTAFSLLFHGDVSMDITDDQFYERSGDPALDASDFRSTLSKGVQKELVRFREAILNLAPCELLSPPTDFSNFDRTVRTLVDYCHDHQREFQDKSLLDELTWRYAASREPDKAIAEELNKKARLLHSQRRDIASDFYTELFTNYAEYAIGASIDLIDATALQERSQMFAWSGFLKKLLKTNEQLASNGVYIRRTLLTTGAANASAADKDIVAQHEHYSSQFPDGNLTGKLVDPATPQILTRFHERSRFEELVKPQNAAVDTLVRRAERLEIVDAFDDLPPFARILRQRRIAKGLQGLLKTTLNQTVFGDHFFVHLNQYFWVTRVVTSKMILADVLEWNKVIQAAPGFLIDELRRVS